MRVPWRGLIHRSPYWQFGLGEMILRDYKSILSLLSCGMYIDCVVYYVVRGSLLMRIAYDNYDFMCSEVYRFLPRSPFFIFRCIAWLVAEITNVLVVDKWCVSIKYMGL